MPLNNLIMSSETALQALITDIVKIPVRCTGFIIHLIAIHDLMMSQSHSPSIATIMAALFATMCGMSLLSLQMLFTPTLGSIG